MQKHALHKRLWQAAPLFCVCAGQQGGPLFGQVSACMFDSLRLAPVAAFISVEVVWQL
jgi:hypothetical protein